MNSLALLCNLYGEGPVTLRRLREAGCRTCDDIGKLDAAELARVLRGSLAAAERFRREAGELTGRTLGEDEPPAPLASPLAPALLAVETPSANETPTAERTLPIQHVGLELRPELLDGLDASACMKLRAHGVLTVEELAAADALDLSSVLDLPVTRAARLQFLARRRAEVRPTDVVLREEVLLPQKSELSAARFSPAENAERTVEPDEGELVSWARGYVRAPLPATPTVRGANPVTAPLQPTAGSRAASARPAEAPKPVVRTPAIADEGASGPFA
ncbi:MAG: hypothetical protein NTV21_20715 [Planctomycetota bacterium]|nr:hypothetical protein [Planctomycetota bacterium]